MTSFLASNRQEQQVQGVPAQETPHLYHCEVILMSPKGRKVSLLHKLSQSLKARYQSKVLNVSCPGSRKNLKPHASVVFDFLAPWEEVTKCHFRQDKKNRGDNFSLALLIQFFVIVHYLE